jgi:hypothetical protein
MHRPFRIQSKKYCVDIPGGLKKNKLPAIIYPCHTGPNQKFVYHRRSKTLRNVATKKCLTYSKGRIVQKPCGKSNTQKFNRRGKKWMHTASKKCLDVEGGYYGTTSRPGKLITYSCHSGTNQKFKTV